MNLHICDFIAQELLTTKHPCTDCNICKLNIQLGAKMGIETYGYQKFAVLAST